MRTFKMTKEIYSNKEFFTLNQGNSTLMSSTKENWYNIIQSMYLRLLTDNCNKNSKMYKESLSQYNFICNYFKIKTI